MQFNRFGNCWTKTHSIIHCFQVVFVVILYAFDALENCHSCHYVVRSWYYFKNLSIALHITMGFNCEFSSGKSAVESFLCCSNLPRNYFMHDYLQCAYTTTTIATAWSNVQLFGSSHCAGRFKCINAVAASLSFFHVGIHSAKLHLYIYKMLSKTLHSNIFQHFSLLKYEILTS